MKDLVCYILLKNLDIFSNKSISVDVVAPCYSVKCLVFGRTPSLVRSLTALPVLVKLSNKCPGLPSIRFSFSLQLHDWQFFFLIVSKCKKKVSFLLLFCHCMNVHLCLGCPYWQSIWQLLVLWVRAMADPNLKMYIINSTLSKHIQQNLFFYRIVLINWPCWSTMYKVFFIQDYQPLYCSLILILLISIYWVAKLPFLAQQECIWTDIVYLE